MQTSYSLRLATHLVCAGVAAAAGMHASAQDPQGTTNTRTTLPTVTISTKANRDPVEKSYRKMIRGMDLFEKERSMSPGASLRFKLLPRKRETDMSRIEMEVIGSHGGLRGAHRA